MMPIDLETEPIMQSEAIVQTVLDGNELGTTTKQLTWEGAGRQDAGGWKIAHALWRRS